MFSLSEEIARRYDPAEYPALTAQTEAWGRDRPLAGLRVLDATPVYHNTLVKYAALLAGGAGLTVGADPQLPSDPEIVALLPRLGIRVLAAGMRSETFDAVLDCAGRHADVPARLGYVELTRSGGEVYRDCGAPVFWVDDSRIKEVETGLGTGDGFCRALRQLGHGDWRGRRIVLFGCGKVGWGVASRALAEGAEVVVVDEASRRAPPPGAAWIPLGDRGAVEAAVRSAWCVVSATGVRGAVSAVVSPSVLVDSGALLANLGVEDEFGEGVPEGRVLNAKRPLNFLLEDPTRLCYIDPAMALHNAGALYLLEKRGTLPCGLLKPPEALEEGILRSVLERGRLAGELERTGLCKSLGKDGR